MKSKMLKLNKLFIALGLMLFMFILVIGFSSIRVNGLDPIDEELPIEETTGDEIPPIEEDVPVVDELPPIEDDVIIPIEEEKGFFENVIIGFFNFVSSAEFTAIVSSIAIIAGGIYTFIRPFLKIKSQAKYDKAIEELRNRDIKINKYEELLLGYAKIVDNSLEQNNAIKESLQLGFDKSNLKQDVKDQIINKLANVKKIEIPKVEDLKVIKEIIEPAKELETLINEVKEITPKGW